MKLRPITCIALAIGLVAAFAFAGDKTYYYGSHSRWNDDKDLPVGTGKMVTQTRTVESFDRITTDMGIDLLITVGQPLSVKITFDDNLVDFVETKVKDDELEITTDASFMTHSNCRAEITIPSLKELHIEGSSEIEINGLKENEFILDIDGSARVFAAGFVDTLFIDLDGSANIDTREIKAHSVRVDLDGTGNVKVFADQEFDGTIDGVGNIVYYGDPKQTYKNVSGMGKIRAK